MTTAGVTATALGIPGSLNPFPIFETAIIPPNIFGETLQDPLLEKRLITACRKWLQMDLDKVARLELPEDRFLELTEQTRDLSSRQGRHAIVSPAFFLGDRNAPDTGIGTRATALVHSEKGNLTLFDLSATRSIHKWSSRVDKRGEVQWKKNLKPGYAEDLALKVYIARSSGVPINHAGILHLGGNWVYHSEEDWKDLGRFFEYTDLTEEMEENLGDVPSRISEIQKRSLSPPSPPPLDISRTGISRLYSFTHPGKKKLREALKTLQVKDIRDISDDLSPQLPLHPIQLRQIRALRGNEIVVEGREILQAALQRILDGANDGRISSLDFEAIEPILPPIRGGQFERRVILQFSNHFLIQGQPLRQDEFLYDGNPLEEGALGRWDENLANALSQSLGNKGPILVYNESFEKSALRELIRRLQKGKKEQWVQQLEKLTIDSDLKVLSDTIERKGLTHFARQLKKTLSSERLAREYMEYLRRLSSKSALILASQIEAVLSTDRFVDFLPLVRNHIYHPDFDAHFDLKTVLRSLCPGWDYDDLEEIRHGSAAAKALKAILAPSTKGKRKADLRKKLLAYCGRDTFALILIFERLCQIAEVDWPFESFLKRKY